MSRREEWIVRELKPGDHIRFKYKSFYHHGLYEGDGMVIHFAGPSMEQLVEPDLVTVRRDIIYNNCEHFVNACVFGKAYSTQIDEMRARID